MKIIGFIRRRPAFTFSQFSHHWRTDHREHALNLDRWLKGYKQAHLLPGPIPDMQRPADGCPILWIDRAEDMVELATSREFLDGAGLDEPRFMEGRSSGLAVEEQILIPPPLHHAKKLMLFLGFRPGTMTAEAPVWSTTHASGHVRNQAVTHDDLDPAIAFDRVDEIWWPDEAAYDADRLASLPFSQYSAIDPVRCRAALVEELVIIQPPRQAGHRAA